MEDATDLKAAFLANTADRKKGGEEGQKIQAIQDMLDRQEEETQNEITANRLPDEDKGKKKKFDINEVIRRKQAEAELESQKKVIDPYAVKLANMPNSTTEDDITEAMSKFGEVKKCRIPTNRETNKPLGFAIVVFSKIEEASRAIAEEEITVDYSCLLVEKAMQSRRPDNRFENARDAFSVLKGGSGGGSSFGGSRGGYGGGDRGGDRGFERRH